MAFYKFILSHCEKLNRQQTNFSFNLWSQCKKFASRWRWWHHLIGVGYLSFTQKYYAGFCRPRPSLWWWPSRQAMLGHHCPPTAYLARRPSSHLPSETSGSVWRHRGSSHWRQEPWSPVWWISPGYMAAQRHFTLVYPPGRGPRCPPVIFLVNKLEASFPCDRETLEYFAKPTIWGVLGVSMASPQLCYMECNFTPVTPHVVTTDRERGLHQSQSNTFCKLI